MTIEGGRWRANKGGGKLEADWTAGSGVGLDLHVGVGCGIALLQCNRRIGNTVYQVTTKTLAAHVTTTQIAAKAGVSRTTVSFALRGHAKIPLATADRVRAAAAELGYRPNPRVAAIMSHIRRSRAVPAGERLAFVWVHTSRAESAKDPFLQRVFLGAKARAEALGYGLEQFWTAERGMTDRRLSQVIKSRGIVGLLLSPVMHEVEVTLDLEWSCFAPAVIGSARWNPEFHHAGHHHYLAMRLVLEKLAERGCRRPFAVLDAETNERARRGWQAAFLAFHPLPVEARELLVIGLAAERGKWAKRCKANGADALIVSGNNIVEQLGAMNGMPPAKTPVVSLNCSLELNGIGGIEDRYDMVAANAVDLVVSQLNSNESGVPAIPRMLLFPGGWVEGKRSAAR